MANILIIDADKLFSMALGEILTREGHQVHQAQTQHSRHQVSSNF